MLRVPPEPAPAVSRAVVHGGEHGRVLAHAEVVVGAPHGDRPGAAAGEVLRGRELAPLAPDVGEYAVAALVPQRLQRFGERLAVIHELKPCAPGEPAIARIPWGCRLEPLA